MLQAIQQLTMLEELRISGGSSLTGRALCMLSMLNNLRILDLRGCGRISWVVLQEAWQAAWLAHENGALTIEAHHLAMGATALRRKAGVGPLHRLKSGGDGLVKQKSGVAGVLLKHKSGIAAHRPLMGHHPAGQHTRGTAAGQLKAAPGSGLGSHLAHLRLGGAHGHDSGRDSSPGGNGLVRQGSSAAGALGFGGIIRHGSIGSGVGGLTKDIARQRSTVQAALLAYLASAQEEDGDDATDNHAMNGNSADMPHHPERRSSSGGGGHHVVLPPPMPFPHLKSLAFTCSDAMISRPIAQMTAVASILGLTHLEITRFQVPDAALSVLSSLTRLNKLKLSGLWSISDAGMEVVANLTTLTSLTLLHPVQITARGLFALSSLRNLASLGLCVSQDLGQGAVGHLATLLPQLTSLDVTYSGWADQCLNALPTSLLNLASLKLHGAGDGFTMDSLPALKALSAVTSLALNNCSKVPAGVILMQGLLPAGLQHLTLSSLSFGNMFSGCVELPPCSNTLTKINLTDCNDVEDRHVRKIVSTYPQLTELNLSGCVAVSDNALMHVSSCRKLKALDVSNTRATGVFADALISLSSLTSLNMSCCSGVKDEGLKHVAAVTSLTSVTVSSCAGVTDRGIIFLMRMPLIGSINVTGCSKVTRDVLLCVPHYIRLISSLT